MILIGSAALREHGVDCSPKDIDIISTYYTFGDFLRKNRHCKIEYFNKGLFRLYDSYKDLHYDILIAEECPELINVFGLDKISSETLIVSSLEKLILLKKAHLIFSINWDKHIRDYQLLLTLNYDKNETENLISKHLEELRKSINYRFGYRSPKLNKDKTSFFDDKVVKYYEHDDIHLLMAHGDRPTYEKLQRPGKGVFCFKKEWDNLSERDKINCVLEESYVIALERKIIPPMFVEDTPITLPYNAFKWALFRICTTLTSGWFRDFAIDNYNKIIDSYSENYINKFFASPPKLISNDNQQAQTRMGKASETTKEQPKNVNSCEYCHPGVCPHLIGEKLPEQCPGH